MFGGGDVLGWVFWVGWWGGVYGSRGGGLSGWLESWERRGMCDSRRLTSAYACTYSPTSIAITRLPDLLV
jgi:hypothetical protein